MLKAQDWLSLLGLSLKDQTRPSVTSSNQYAALMWQYSNHNGNVCGDDLGGGLVPPENFLKEMISFESVSSVVIRETAGVRVEI